MWTAMAWLKGYALAIKRVDSGILDPFLGHRLLGGQKLSLDVTFLVFYCNGVLLAQNCLRIPNTEMTEAVINPDNIKFCAYSIT